VIVSQEIRTAFLLNFLLVLLVVFELVFLLLFSLIVKHYGTFKANPKIRIPVATRAKLAAVVRAPAASRILVYGVLIFFHLAFPFQSLRMSGKYSRAVSPCNT
jgi:hypothetical protein